MLTEKEATVMPRCSDWVKDREKKESQRSYYWSHYMPVGFPYTIIWHTWGRKVIQYIVYKLRTKEHMLSHYSFEDTGLIYLCISTAVCVCMRVCVNMCVYTHGYPETVKCNFIWMIKQKYSVHFFFFSNFLAQPRAKAFFSVTWKHVLYSWIFRSHFWGTLGYSQLATQRTPKPHPGIT